MRETAAIAGTVAAARPATGAATAAADTGATGVVPDAPPRLTHVFTIAATLGPPQEQGVVDGWRTRFVPVTGGRVSGPRLRGVVLAGGGDWQAIHAGGLTRIDARYALRGEDGTVIAVANPGVRVAAPDVAQRLAAGEAVDPALYYFRTSPRLTASDGSHAWLGRTLFVGRGIRRPDSVEIQVFAVE